VRPMGSKAGNSVMNMTLKYQTAGLPL
jgi:hypothetical protein